MLQFNAGASTAGIAQAHWTFERRSLDRTLPEIMGDPHYCYHALINFRHARLFSVGVNGDAGTTRQSDNGKPAPIGLVCTLPKKGPTLGLGVGPIEHRVQLLVTRWYLSRHQSSHCPNPLACPAHSRPPPARCSGHNRAPRPKVSNRQPSVD